MSDKKNTLFLRLEGPMQAWGAQESKFLIRRTLEAPTKSGLIGLLFAALGISRTDADANDGELLKKFSVLKIGIRIDKPGIRWWDYHTVGGGMKDVNTKLSRREYLCDASFLVAINGEPGLIEQIHNALLNPIWTLYLGRKSCPPSVPIYSGIKSNYDNLLSALSSVEWRPRYKNEKKPDFIECLIDWFPSENEPHVPHYAEIWYDIPDSFVYPSHHPRFVIRTKLTTGEYEDIKIGEHLQNLPSSPERPRTDYNRSTWGKVQKRRLEKDNHICVFCKSPANTVQHINYRQSTREANKIALGDEYIMVKHLENHRTLCRLCHDAVTMIEYGEGMGLDRINPEEPHWRERIILKRQEIIKHRSQSIRKRKLSGEDI